MDLIVCLALFLCAIAGCMATGLPLYLALAVGFVCFFIAGLHRGFSFRALLSMAASGGRTALVVLRILVLIGCLTALWRCSGTVSFFVYTGLRLVTPRLFILIAFLLPALFCMAFGSSFGVAGTAGVVLMVMARSGGANLLLTAGAILSGCFFGERLSPASSAAILTATVSGTTQEKFQAVMWRRTPVPTAITLAFYAIASWMFPIRSVDDQILRVLEEGFNLNWLTIVPAVVLLLLPAFHFTAARSILVSCLLAAVVALAVQGMSPAQLLHDIVFGHTVAHPALTDILSGGGLLSMVNVVAIVFLSCAYSGILSGTKMLAPVKDKLDRLAGRLGLFPTLALVSAASAGLLCNQSVAIVMSAQMMGESYLSRGRSEVELAADLGDTAITIAAMVPWCIACSVPLATIGASALCVPFAVHLYAIPLCAWLLNRKR